MFGQNICLRGRAALGLLIVEAFHNCADVSEEDQSFVKSGTALAWRWVEGHLVRPMDVCEYIDGEINLPIRSTGYGRGTPARDYMVSAFHSIGLVALYSCEELSIHPSEAVENFGENEWELLCQRLDRLDESDRRNIFRFEKYISSIVEYERSNIFGKPILRQSIVSY